MISAYMRKNIKYTPKAKKKIAAQNGYWWKTPEETFTDKYGFCYDLSAFALHCLIENGYSNAKLLFVCWGNWGRDSRSGHVVAMFQKNKKYYSIDNGKLLGPFKSLENVIRGASHNHKVKHSKTFEYNEIPYHTPYNKMDYFCD